jgi:hypothetical protein
MSWNKHIFYRYRKCLLNVKQMDILCGDTIYKCCKFVDLVEHTNNRYTIYLKNRRNTKYVSSVFTKSNELAVITCAADDDEILRILKTLLMTISIKQRTCYYTVMEIFLKEGYYLSENVFKLLKVCGGSTIRVFPRQRRELYRRSYGRVRKNPRV